MSKTTKNIASAIKDASKSKTSGYDTQAVVKRIEGNTAWVHIPGGVDETPVQMTMAAKPGDVVQVRVSNGRAWLYGNATAPPTDDTRANFAVGAAIDAGKEAGRAKDAADRAEASAEEARTQAVRATGYANDSLSQLSIVEDVVGTLNWITTHATYKLTGDEKVKAGKWYFTKSGDTYNVVINPTGDPSAQGWYEIDTIDEAVSNYIASHLALTDAGLWVTKDNQSYKILLANDSMKVYDDAGRVVASYGSTAIIGPVANNTVRTVISGGATSGGMEVIRRTNNGADERVIYFGYANGNAESGKEIAPYLTLGTRITSEEIGNYSITSGYFLVASGYASHAQGAYTKAIGSCAHAEGFYSTAYGAHSHVEGYGNNANGDNSHASGMATIANGEAQTVIGKYNVADTTSLFIIGKGTSNSERSNALTVDSSGNVVASGGITSAGAKVPTRNQICYANSRVDNFTNGQITLALSALGITTGAKPVGILLTHQDGGSSPTILRYDYDASSASGVVIRAYDSSGAAVSGAVRYFAVVFQNSWTSTT
ncbi:MAG: hypothetical protein U0K35_02110 [Prevotella sp.]|nr:hypothetical protein [Prevotella sp.]